MRIVVAACLVLAVHLAYASFVSGTTGTVDERRNNKYTLKNFNRSVLTKYSLTTFRPSLYDFKGSQTLRSQSAMGSGSMEVNSLMRFENGNTAYIFPYKYKMKVSKFVTPSRH
ncbi:MAG: hypothetical protein JWN76_160 [Chitinophagaceae bacterium]|nr:hypothetical protein [Chitinophagaceae bacterium]